jgi:hypothetical protein
MSFDPSQISAASIAYIHRTADANAALQTQ